jgi:hypothetical protein
MKRKPTEGQIMAQKRRAGKIRAKRFPNSGVILYTEHNKLRASWARARA